MYHENNEYELAKKNMVRNQVRVVGVEDELINDTMLKIPRHLFVAPYWESVAYSDAELPMHQEGDSIKRFISRPEMFAKILEVADLRKTDIVLDMGCGTGYSTTVIAELAKEVIGIDCCPTMINRAEKITRNLGISNAYFHTMDILNDVCSNTISPDTFDVVIINGAVYRYTTDALPNHMDMINPLTAKLPTILSQYLKRKCEVDDDMTKTSRIIAVEGTTIYSPMHIVEYDVNMNRKELSEGYVPKLF